jgi:hypothetical protein
VKHDEKLARVMIDWDFWKAGLFNLVRQDGDVIGLRWQWDEYDYAALWVNQRPGMDGEDRDGVLERYSRPIKQPDLDQYLGGELLQNGRRFSFMFMIAV